MITEMASLAGKVNDLDAAIAYDGRCTQQV